MGEKANKPTNMDYAYFKAFIKNYHKDRIRLVILVIKMINIICILISMYMFVLLLKGNSVKRRRGRGGKDGRWR